MNRLLLFSRRLNIALTHRQLIDCLQLCLIGRNEISPVVYGGDVARHYLLAVIAVASTSLRLASSNQHFSIAREI